MSFQIRKVAVLGAGVMGSGIAAHLANAGVPCLLLDIVPPKAAEGEDTSSRAFRNKFAAGAVARLPKANPPAITTNRAVQLIEVGNFEDDMARLGECDWVIEVVKEDLAIKQRLFAQVEQHVGPNAIISSNTSGLSIVGMTEGRSASFKQRFLVTHFFNPVRWMKLLELVRGPETLPEVVEAIHQFGERRLGKGIVYGKDTTNFIANRIGVYAIMKTLEEMRAAELTVEEVDKIFGPPMGRPKSAVFRTADVVGLDTFMHVAQNCYDSLVDDEARETFKAPAFLTKMVENGWLGEKSGQGFYKKGKDAEGNRVILSLDLDTFDYRPPQKVRFDSLGAARGKETAAERIVAVLSGEDKAARFAEKVNLDVLAYTSRRIPEIADDIVNIDRGVRWGFAWDLGPFEMWDAYGVERGLARMKELGLQPAEWVEKMVAAGRTSFYATENGIDTYWDALAGEARPVQHPRGQIKAAWLKRAQNTPLLEKYGAYLWDMGEGIALLEFNSRPMNLIDNFKVEAMHESLDLVERDFRGLVIGNDDDNFCAGANLLALSWAINAGSWADIEKLVTGFQSANQRMRFSSVPVVTAPTGYTFGGGAETMMGGNAVQTHSDAIIGLVEVGVGLIPGGGGNLQLLRNVYGPFAEDADFDPFPFIKKVLLTIGTAHICKSGEEARERGFLTAGDGISMNRDLVLHDARARAIGMAEAGFIPPRPQLFRLPGRSMRATVDMMAYDMQLNGMISEHDRKIFMHLATILSGGDTTSNQPVSEDRLLELEKEAFLSLCGEAKTQARIEHMLKTNKPLRN